MEGATVELKLPPAECRGKKVLVGGVLLQTLELELGSPALNLRCGILSSREKLQLRVCRLRRKPALKVLVSQEVLTKVAVLLHSKLLGRWASKLQRASAAAAATGRLPRGIMTGQLAVSCAVALTRCQLITSARGTTLKDGLDSCRFVFAAPPASIAQRARACRCSM
eukprot:12901-Heterococcus_DN1.PRE.1